MMMKMNLILLRWTDTLSPGTRKAGARTRKRAVQDPEAENPEPMQGSGDEQHTQEETP